MDSGTAQRLMRFVRDPSHEKQLFLGIFMHSILHYQKKSRVKMLTSKIGCKILIILNPVLLYSQSSKNFLQVREGIFCGQRDWTSIERFAFTAHLFKVANFIK